MLRANPAEGWMLIHGSVRVGISQREYVLLMRGGHAWLERRGLIYDPKLDVFEAWAAYSERYDAIETHRYRRVVAWVEGAKTRHSGPWP